MHFEQYIQIFKYLQLLDVFHLLVHPDFANSTGPKPQKFISIICAKKVFFFFFFSEERGREEFASS